MKRVILLLIAAMYLCGCTNTKSILYRGSMFGTMTGQMIMKGDDGNVYHFTNMLSTNAVPETGRIVALFDVYSKLDGTENEYDAELLSFNVPLHNEPVLCSSAEEEAALGDDPIKMEDGALSGGHLNMLCSIMLHDAFVAQHIINLQEIPGATTDTVHFVLRHNAGEDKVTDETSENVTLYPFYASFPILDKFPKGKTTVLELKWYWNNDWNYEYATIKR